MSDTPLISIITPTLNSEVTIEACLNSVASQTYKNIEHIIIDGLSSDLTLKIIEKFQTEFDHIMVISEKDTGIYDAMNKGIKLAKGEWLYFLGSDDRFYNENVLDKISNFIKVSNPLIIYGNVLIDGDAGWADSGQIYDGEFTLPKLIEKNICHQAIFFNKIVFNKCGKFNLKYNICADWDMNLRLWATFRFHFIETIITIFKGGNSSKLIVNNYSDIEKWLNILNSFGIGITSREFAHFYENFLILSNYFRKEREYFKSFLMLCIFYFQKSRAK